MQTYWVHAESCKAARETYVEVRHYSNGWAAEREIDWSRAVASLVKLPLEE
jgi:hypothetical protein